MCVEATVIGISEASVMYSAHLSFAKQIDSACCDQVM